MLRGDGVRLLAGPGFERVNLEGIGVSVYGPTTELRFRVLKSRRACSSSCPEVVTAVCGASWWASSARADAAGCSGLSEVGEGKVLERLAQNWWVVALRGALAVLFGLIALVWPGLTLTVLVIVFGAYALVDGVMAGYTAIRGWQAPGGSRGWLVLECVAGIAAGVVALFWPAITAVALVVLIGAWAVVTGVMEIAGAIYLRRQITNEWWLALTGVLSVILGAFLLAAPGEGAVAFAWVIGIYALLFGFAVLALGFRLRKHRDLADSGLDDLARA